MSKQSSQGLEASEADERTLENAERLSESRRLLEEIKANILSGNFAAGLKLTETDRVFAFARWPATKQNGGSYGEQSFE